MDSFLSSVSYFESHVLLGNIYVEHNLCLFSILQGRRGQNWRRNAAACKTNPDNLGNKCWWPAVRTCRTLGKPKLMRSALYNLFLSYSNVRLTDFAQILSCRYENSGFSFKEAVLNRKQYAIICYALPEMYLFLPTII